MVQYPETDDEHFPHADPLMVTIEPGGRFDFIPGEIISEAVGLIDPDTGDAVGIVRSGFRPDHMPGQDQTPVALLSPDAKYARVDFDLMTPGATIVSES